MDTPRRSVAKSITWRITGIVILGFIAYAATRSWSATTGITVVFHGLRLFLYYAHERLWERTAWGRVKHPLAELPVRSDLSAEEIAAIREYLDENGFTPVGAKHGAGSPLPQARHRRLGAA